MTDEIPTRAQRGCLFYGGIAGIVCLVAVLVAGLLGLHQLRRMLRKYTDTKPMTMPAVEISAAKLDELQRRVELFRDDLRVGRPTAPLALSSDEINALIQHDPEFKTLKEKAFVTLSGRQLEAQISVPMQQLGLPRFRGRYFNGTGVFSLSLRNGVLDARAEELMVKGQPLPPMYMNAIRRQNLAESANDNPRTSVGLNMLQSIEVRDGKLFLIPKDYQ